MDVSPIVNEMVSIADFIGELYEENTVLLQNVPENPQSGTFLIQFQNDNRERISALAISGNREYRVIYFGDQAPDVLKKMDGLSRLFLYGRRVIPIKDEENEEGSLRYIRVMDFSFGEIFKTVQNEDVEACIGVLQTQTKEARDVETYEKIMEVYTRFKNND